MIESIKNHPEIATAVIVFIWEYVVEKLPIKANSTFSLIWQVAGSAAKIILKKGA